MPCNYIECKILNNDNNNDQSVIILCSSCYSWSPSATRSHVDPVLEVSTRGCGQSSSPHCLLSGGKGIGCPVTPGEGSICDKVSCPYVIVSVRIDFFLHNLILFYQSTRLRLLICVQKCSLPSCEWTQDLHH